MILEFLDDNKHYEYQDPISLIGRADSEQQRAVADRVAARVAGRSHCAGETSEPQSRGSQVRAEPQQLSVM